MQKDRLTIETTSITLKLHRQLLVIYRISRQYSLHAKSGLYMINIFQDLISLIFPGSNDWEWLYDDVPDKLRELHHDGYRVAFFTNQAGIEKLKVTPETIKIKIEAMIKDLDFPCLVSLNYQ